MESAQKFLEAHLIRPEDVSIQSLVDDFTSEMINGLNGIKSSLRMIPTYIEADNQFLTDKNVLAIDAGGTNFRAALVMINSIGKLEITDVVNSIMPGLDAEISKKEFFETIALHIKPLAEKCDRIGFCFSYPTEILPNKDGRLLQFCKEVKAPEVVGQLIGKNLLETLEMPEKKIVLLNDTVATLLAGKSATFGKTYDTFIGYILGTGTNTCYIENNSNIGKLKEPDIKKSQIINIESGNYGNASQTGIDRLFDQTTVNPGDYTFEKMMSGGYLGGLCLMALKTASREGIFTGTTAQRIISTIELTSGELNSFISRAETGSGSFSDCFSNPSDEKTAVTIIDGIIHRAAKLVAGNLAAVILKTDKGKTPGIPILITVEGSLYYKLLNMRSLIDAYLNGYLTGERKRYFEFIEVGQSSLVGAALAALTRDS